MALIIIEKNNIISLKEYLEKYGLHSNDVNKLLEIYKADHEPSSLKKISKTVTTFLKDAVCGVASEVIVKALSHYIWI